MKVKGYKCFKEDMTGFMNTKFEVGKKYHLGEYPIIKYNHYGYHFCSNFEDTFMFFKEEVKQRKIQLCEVEGSGSVNTYFDDYRDLYYAYASSNLEIIRKIPAEEIFEMGKQLFTTRLTKFISLYRLTEEEIMELKQLFSNDLKITSYIEYYQEGKKDAFIKRRRLK